MAFYCSTMLSMALELASEDAVYEDVASKFFEHFIAITDAMNSLGGTGLWDEGDGFYYDQLAADGKTQPLRVRSMVGIIPLFACEILEESVIDRLPGFRKRMQWFLDNREDLAEYISYMCTLGDHSSHESGHRLLALPSQPRLERVLRYLLDESEFLSPYGIRSMSRVHRERPYVLTADGHEYRVDYEPGDSNSGHFGGNSNWRGPVWLARAFGSRWARSRVSCNRGSLASSSPGPTDADPCTATTIATRTIRIGATSCSFTSTSMATMAAASALAIRPGGARSQCRASRTSRATARRRPFVMALRLGRTDEWPTASTKRRWRTRPCRRR
jgi:hypothetical protein